MSSSRLAPKLDETRGFFQAVGISPAEAITFQTFDDSEEKRQQLARILHGPLEQHTEELTRLNQEGAGIFWTPNQTDGNGRKAKNIIQVRAVFVDLDGSPLQPVLDAELTPHVIVESSPGRYHAYWCVSDVRLEQFSPIQKALAAKFNGDPKVHDLPRVMRLPGFWHRKGEAFQTRIVEVNHVCDLHDTGDHRRPGTDI